METNCPKCSQKLVVEDAKVPAGPFMLRCPKCQNAIKLLGKAGAAPTGESAAAQEPPQPAAFPPSPKPAVPKPKPAPPPMQAPASKQAPPPAQAAPPPPTPRSQPVQQSQPASVGEPSQDDGSSRRALIVLDDQSVQNVMAAALQRIGLGVDVAPDADQGVRFLERESYALVATARNGNANGAGLYNRIITFAPEARRNLFLVLVGSDLSTGDGTQAFAAMVDLVLSPKDIGASDELLRSTMYERTRLYQTFLDAQVRVDARKY